VGELAHPCNGAIDQCNAFGVIASALMEIDLQRGEHLTEVIMELASDSATLRLLCLDQFARQRLELLRPASQLLLGDLAISDIGMGAVRTQQTSTGRNPGDRCFHRFRARAF
jgi:hypothetical protein